MDGITQSVLRTFLRCAYQFERPYLRGEIIPRGIATRRGSAPHRAEAEPLCRDHPTHGRAYRFQEIGVGKVPPKHYTTDTMGLQAK
jgi:hypothetical protein